MQLTGNNTINELIEGFESLDVKERDTLPMVFETEKQLIYISMYVDKIEIKKGADDAA